MEKVGEFVQKALEELDNRMVEPAFVATCGAIEKTIKKSLASDDITGGDYQDFVKWSWQLIVFMGLPRALPLPREVETKVKAIVYGFHIRSAEELVTHLVMQTARMGRLPLPFKFHNNYIFEVRDNQIYIPASLAGALLGIVVFHPINKDEKVPDKYWISVSDFKMFVSELWGRIDLAERIMNYNRRRM